MQILWGEVSDHFLSPGAGAATIPNDETAKRAQLEGIKSLQIVSAT